MASSNQTSQYLSGWRLFLVISSIFMGNFLIALDTNIVNVAVPYISTRFKALNDVSWYGSAYLLTLTALQPVFGVLYRFFDIQVTYMSCIAIFEVGSVLCAAAVSSNMFIVGRALAGTGAAGVLQGALSTIGNVVELEKRPTYFGIVISVFIISVCIGPVLGGVFTTRLTWRWCFWINLPCGAVVLVLLIFFLRVDNKNSPDRRRSLKDKLSHLEPIGCTTFLGAVTCLVLALQWGGQTLPWSSATVIGLFVGAGLLLSVFVLVQWKRGEKAMIPLRILRQRSIWTGALVLFWLGLPSYILAFYLPFYYQAVQGVDAITSGVRFIPLVLPQIIAIVVVGGIVSRIGHYVPIMLIGEAVCAVGTGLLTQSKVNTRTVEWAAWEVVSGLGFGAAMMQPYTAIQVALPEEDVPVANAIAVFAWQLGGAVGIAAGQTISLNTIVTEVHDKLSGVSASAVIAAGATDLHLVATSDAMLLTLRSIWNTAVTRTIWLSLAAILMSIPFTCGMEWLNAKTAASNRRRSYGTTGDCDVERAEKQGLQTSTSVADLSQEELIAKEVQCV